MSTIEYLSTRVPSIGRACGARDRRNSDDGIWCKQATIVRDYEHELYLMPGRVNTALGSRLL